MSSLSAKKSHREENVLSALQKKKYLKTGEVADMLNASECTVRRFFSDLEKKGMALRVYGGIKIAPSKHGEYYFENLQLRQSEQKQRIGEFGSRLVENGDILFLDSGTTIQQMALSLVVRFKQKELQDVQIFTNSLRNLTILAQYCDVNLIGGLFRNKRQDFCGYLSEMVLESISFEKCFLSADGVSIDAGDGVMATDVFTAKINQIVARRARGVYLLADSTKFVRRSFIKYASVEDVKMIVTDAGLPESVESALASLGPIIQKV
ncbi:MAG: DeoR/GlpR family DNA-binding transcription regulator [Clostridia bacterium]